MPGRVEARLWKEDYGLLSSLPLILDMQIRVGTDGSHTFERLDMSRP